MNIGTDTSHLCVGLGLCEIGQQRDRMSGFVCLSVCLPNCQGTCVCASVWLCVRLHVAISVSPPRSSLPRSHARREDSNNVVQVKQVVLIRSHVNTSKKDPYFGSGTGYLMRVNQISTAEDLDRIWTALLIRIVGESLLPEDAGFARAVAIHVLAIRRAAAAGRRARRADGDEML